MAGLTETGFKRRTYDEILDDKIQKAKELFGEDINTDENTPLGKFIRINAYEEALISEDMELVYYSIFPNTASGVSLDRLCAFVGITRNHATPARYLVSLTGTEGETVPYGFLIGTESGIEFYNTKSETINEKGNVLCEFECTQNGTIGNRLADEITQIIETVPYIDEIDKNNPPYRTERGEEEESDYSLRKRFEAARVGLGTANIPSIISEITKIPSILSVGIVENSTDETDSEGRPPHSFECYINSTDYQSHKKEIAEAIFNKKPLGIQTHGSVSQTVTDVTGGEHTIKFSPTTKVTVYVKISIKTDSSYGGDDSTDEIKTKVEEYIDTLGVGADVILSQLYSRIYSVTGVTEVSTLQLSQNGSTWGTSNITVNSHSVAMCLSVTLTVVS